MVVSPKVQKKKKKKMFVKGKKITARAGFLLKGKESILWVGMSTLIFNHELKSVSGSSSYRKSAH